MLKTITKNNFKKLLMETNKLVLLEFYSPTCRPCQMQLPIVESLANEVGDQAVIGKVNIDEELEIANQFKILSIPTIVFLEKGKVKNFLVGLQTKNELKKYLNI